MLISLAPPSLSASPTTGNAAVQPARTSTPASTATRTIAGLISSEAGGSAQQKPSPLTTSATRWCATLKYPSQSGTTVAQAEPGPGRRLRKKRRLTKRVFSLSLSSLFLSFSLLFSPSLGEMFLLRVTVAGGQIILCRPPSQALPLHAILRVRFWGHPPKWRCTHWLMPRHRANCGSAQASVDHGGIFDRHSRI